MACLGNSSRGDGRRIMAPHAMFANNLANPSSRRKLWNTRMTDLTLVVKGDKHQAVLAAKLRGIPLVCRDEGDGGAKTMGTAPASFRDKVSAWLGEGGDLVSFAPALAHYLVKMHWASNEPRFKNARRLISIPAKDSYDALNLANKMYPCWRAIDAILKPDNPQE